MWSTSRWTLVLTGGTRDIFKIIQILGTELLQLLDDGHTYNNMVLLHTKSAIYAVIKWTWRGNVVCLASTTVRFECNWAHLGVSETIGFATSAPQQNWFASCDSKSFPFYQ